MLLRRICLAPLGCGIPTDEVLQEMRAADEPPVQYLVGTPKGRLGKMEAELLKLPWQQARESVRVKLLPRENELYVCIESQARVGKERSLRRRRLKALLARLKERQRQRPSYESLLLKLGAAKSEAGRAWSLVEITLPARPARKADRRERVDFTFTLDKERLRTTRRREGRYLLRSNLTDTDPAKLWQMYLQLTQVEQAFKDLKSEPFGKLRAHGSACAPSIIKKTAASKRPSWSASWLTVCMSRCVRNCAATPPA